jgi:hypothetical protein
MMAEMSQEEIDRLVIVTAGDTLARHLEWIIDEPTSGLTPDVIDSIKQSAREDLAWWDNVLKVSGYASPRKG